MWYVQSPCALDLVHAVSVVLHILCIMPRVFNLAAPGIDLSSPEGLYALLWLCRIARVQLLRRWVSWWRSTGKRLAAFMSTSRDPTRDSCAARHEVFCKAEAMPAVISSTINQLDIRQRMLFL